MPLESYFWIKKRPLEMTPLKLLKRPLASLNSKFWLGDKSLAIQTVWVKSLKVANLTCSRSLSKELIQDLLIGMKKENLWRITIWNVAFTSFESL